MKPKAAFVTTPSFVFISGGSAKKARNASDIPSSRSSGPSAFGAARFVTWGTLEEQAHLRAGTGSSRR
jgi:hypothetical protein